MTVYKPGTEKRQLFYLFDNLSSCVQDETMLGGIVGYSIALSLGKYNRNDFPRQPNPHREIQAVYDGLEKLGEDYIDSTSEIQPVLFKLKEATNPLLKKYIANHTKERHDSNLFATLLASISQQNPNLEELLRRHGIGITREVAKRGALVYVRNRVFCEDYELLESYFKKITRGSVKP